MSREHIFHAILGIIIMTYAHSEVLWCALRRARPNFSITKNKSTKFIGISSSRKFVYMRAREKKSIDILFFTYFLPLYYMKPRIHGVVEGEGIGKSHGRHTIMITYNYTGTNCQIAGRKETKRITGGKIYNESNKERICDLSPSLSLALKNKNFHIFEWIYKFNSHSAFKRNFVFLVFRSWKSWCFNSPGELKWFRGAFFWKMEQVKSTQGKPEMMETDQAQVAATES